MAFTVYVLVSQTSGRRYTGQTQDLPRRLAEHNTPDHNQTKHTTRFPGPWVLVHAEDFETRSEAVRRERWLKSGAGRAWLDSQLGRASPPQAD